MYHTKALSQVVSPVTTDELFSWVRGADECDPILQTSLNVATSQVIEFLQLELMPRTRVTTWHTWPTVGTVTTGLSKTEAHYKTLLELPYANLISVDGVEIFGEVTTDYTAFDSQRPALIDLSETSIYIDNDVDDAISVQYIAGFGDGADDVPEDIKTAIMTAAGFLYDHRGNCNINDLLKDSGAAAMIMHHKVDVVVF